MGMSIREFGWNGPYVSCSGKHPWNWAMHLLPSAPTPIQKKLLLELFSSKEKFGTTVISSCSAKNSSCTHQMTTATWCSDSFSLELLKNKYLLWRDRELSPIVAFRQPVVGEQAVLVCLLHAKGGTFKSNTNNRKCWSFELVVLYEDDDKKLGAPRCMRFECEYFECKVTWMHWCTT